jgi:glyoxalase family protein
VYFSRLLQNPPGFTIDERDEELGTHLVLPPWLGPMRRDLVEVLPPVRLPKKNEITTST